MRTRLNRIDDFKAFQTSSKEILKKVQKQSPDYMPLEDYYGFTVCPKGRSGGVNERLIEVFYGNRPYDQEIVINEQLKPSPTLLTESGAELSLFRDDFGYVSIQLIPAKSKYGRQKEDWIILEAHLDPKRLLRPRFQKFLLQSLNSYMAVTCLEGKPTVCDRIRVWWIRTTKYISIDEKIQPIKIWKALGDVFKFVFTVGLSGFLLLLIEKYV